MHTDYLQLIADRKLSIGIIGLGYVGLPLVQAFVEKGFDTIGFDIDESKVELLRNGQSYIKHIPSDKIQEMVKSEKFNPTADFSLLDKTDVIVVCVPTPLTNHREPDLSYIISTTNEIKKQLKEEHLIVFESTTYPGTTEEVIRPMLEQGGLKCGEDFFLAYSPEREDPGNRTYTTQTIPKVIGGCNDVALKRAAALYSEVFEEIVEVSSMNTAEGVKILENIFRSVNIALVNELKIIYDKMGIDIWEVIEAAKTKPFGFMPFYPGPGPGGHCIPIDPFYLTWKAREYNVPTRFIELAGEVNDSMPQYIINKLIEALNDRGKSLKGSRIIVVGIAYKSNVDDMRESPSLKLIDMLMQKGASVEYYDPYIPVISRTRRFPRLENMNSIAFEAENFNASDAVLIATDHSNVDYEFIVRETDLIVDARNATADVKEGREKIVKA